MFRLCFRLEVVWFAGGTDFLGLVFVFVGLFWFLVMLLCFGCCLGRVDLWISLASPT